LRSIKVASGRASRSNLDLTRASLFLIELETIFYLVNMIYTITSSSFILLSYFFCKTVKSLSSAPADIFFSSGTTGNAKMIEHSQASMGLGGAGMRK